MTDRKPAKLRLEHLPKLTPLTDAQGQVFESWYKDFHLLMNGSAGSGKTFLALYLGLEEVLNKDKPHTKKVVIIRSAVPTRDMGFMPGTKEEKEEPYLGPYKAIVKELFDEAEAWDKLIAAGQIEFITTSFIRGITIDNAVIIVDEMQNCNFHELDSIITRVGNDCRFVMCGDYFQSDFHRTNDKDGILKFMKIVEQMKMFSTIEFTWKDIVRSDFVRDYIMSKEQLGVTS